MRAFLLAAGLGTRLRPLTAQMPKCLVPIAGRPLLAYWLALFGRHGIHDVLINTHHLPEQVDAFARDNRTDVRLTTCYEPQLLGSAGTVRANRDWIADGAPFVIAYADNLTSANLSALVAAHEQHRPVLTMGLFRTDQPQRCGILELDREGDEGRVVGFEEKPARPKSNLANAGIYVTDRRILDYLPETVPADFGIDVLPRLVGNMYGRTIEPIIDVGTLDSYQQAQTRVREWGLVEQLFGTEVQ